MNFSASFKFLKNQKELKKIFAIALLKYDNVNVKSKSLILMFFLPCLIV